MDSFSLFQLLEVHLFAEPVVSGVKIALVNLSKPTFSSSFTLNSSSGCLYSRVKSSNKDEWLFFVFQSLSLKLAASHWGLVEQTVVFEERSHWFYFQAHCDDFTECWLRKHSWLLGRKVLFKCQVSNTKISLCRNKQCVCVTVQRGSWMTKGCSAVGNWKEKGFPAFIFIWPKEYFCTSEPKRGPRAKP